jgi:uncharacterized protein YjbI with pentapeptide repeats
MTMRAVENYGAWLRGEQEDKPNLRGADLSGADLSKADLREADLREADLYGAQGAASFGPIGLERRIGYALAHESGPRVKLGCFWGTEAEALAAIETKYGAGSLYAGFVKLACRAVTEGAS